MNNPPIFQLVATPFSVSDETEQLILLRNLREQRERINTSVLSLDEQIKHKFNGDLREKLQRLKSDIKLLDRFISELWDCIHGHR